MSTFAVGVLDAERMYASWISCLAEVVALKCRCTCDSRCADAEGFRREDMAVLAVLRDMMGKKSRLENQNKRSGCGGQLSEAPRLSKSMSG
jgi:hypothetical protein